MFGSLLAVLLASAQPVPTEEPVDTGAEVSVEIETEVQADAPVVAAEVPAAEVAAAAEVEAEAEAAPAEPEEEIICRRRLRPSERIGQRHRVVRDCRPASEWANTPRRRLGGD